MIDTLFCCCWGWGDGDEDGDDGDGGFDDDGEDDDDTDADTDREVMAGWMLVAAAPYQPHQSAESFQEILPM